MHVKQDACFSKLKSAFASALEREICQDLPSRKSMKRKKYQRIQNVELKKHENSKRGSVVRSAFYRRIYLVCDFPRG